MLKIEVKFSDEGIQAALARVAADLSAATELHQAIAMGVEEGVRAHLLERNSRSPHTGFYAKASRSVESKWDADSATFTVPHTGSALRYYGGRVDMKDRLLALPTENVPVRGDERMRPGEIPDLAFLPAGKNAKPGTRGYLLEGKMNKKGTRLVPKTREEGGKLMFVLREWTDHLEDPTVIPSEETLQATARDAGQDYLTAMIAGEGLA